MLSPLQHSRWLVGVTLILTCLSTQARAHEAKVPAELPSKPNPVSVWPGGDPQTRPQDSLFQFANGKWLQETEIPGDKRSYGTFLLLREQADQEVKRLLDAAVRNPQVDEDAKIIGAFYGSMLDLPEMEQRGLLALSPVLRRIDQISDPLTLARTLGHLCALGVGIPIGVWVGPDAKAPGINKVYWSHGGLGLPDREDYLGLDEKSEARRVAYHVYLEELLAFAASDPTAVGLAPLDFASLEKAAEATFRFEKSLATLHWKRPDRRDPLKTYNPRDLVAIPSEFPGFPWNVFASAVGMEPDASLVVREPSFFRGFASLAIETPWPVWRAYLRARTLDAYASVLPARYRKSHYVFHGKALQGLTEPPPRWQTAVKETNSYVGESIGKRFVATHFSTAAKTKMNELVNNLLAVYRESLGSLTWMTQKTREAALIKLAGMRVKIGYPDTWRGYAGLELHSKDALGNTMRAARYHHEREMVEAGRPVDRARWLMNPQMVNAYYNPLGNEIVFPAAILRPPFFDVHGDAAYNYGAIGAVIGHEISHGFDDSGRRYDAQGRLRDWWTPADEEAFTQRAAQLIEQYNAYQALPDLKVNGKLTLGENIADLAGVSIAHRAYMRSLDNRPAPDIDGFTASQRFFLGYARVWRSKSRPEWLRTRIMIDPHAPEEYRTNGVVTNLDSFHDAFGLKASDKLYKAPDQRVRIW
ncbi:MAG: M13 family metallopeptidase [Candidatus Sericytochromatia bacterium]|nr:M13 family metallopeptidase [Candidatus Sericytochromatia bacterium]